MGITEKSKCIKLAQDIADEIQITPALFDAFCNVDRSEFAPILAHAFSLNAQPILANQWISSPLTVAKMTMALELDDDVDSALEIGCGSGYQAAILSKIVRRIFAVERIERLVYEAKKHFDNLRITNINVRHDDGNNGWKTYSPYDRILVSAATKTINQKLFQQLRIKGILVAPIIIDDKQFIVKFTKNEDETITEEIIEECEFVPLLSGCE